MASLTRKSKTRSSPANVGAKPLDAEITEEDVLAQVLQGCEWRGIRVLKTIERRRRFEVECPCCRHRFRVRDNRGRGVDRGIGDLLLRLDSNAEDPRWAPGMWLMIDLKRPVGWSWSSPEQRANAEAGGLLIAHSFADVEAALEAWRRREEAEDGDDLR